MGGITGPFRILGLSAKDSKWVLGSELLEVRLSQLGDAGRGVCFFRVRLEGTCLCLEALTTLGAIATIDST